MAHTSHNPASVGTANGGYSHGIEVRSGARYLWISGQIPESQNTPTPLDFAAQCALVWENIAAILHAAGMTVHDLVKVTTYLSNRQYAMENRQIRERVLGDARPALTVIIADIFDSAWLLEIEAVAAATDK